MKLGMVAERGLRISRAYIIDGLYNGGVGLCDVMIDESDHPFLLTYNFKKTNCNNGTERLSEKSNVHLHGWQSQHVIYGNGSCIRGR